MKFKKAISEAIADDIFSGYGKLKINLVKNIGEFEAFNYLGSDDKEVKVGDNIDYLKLFMRIAEKAYLENKDNFGSYILASNIGGANIFGALFSSENKAKFKHGYTYLRSFLKGKAAEGLETKVGFWCEVSLVEPAETNFAKEAPKVLKILKDDNKSAWLEIMEKRLKFLKTDMYILDLPKLHSWGFQIINSQGDPDREVNYVRAKVPKPRGQSRKKK